METFLKLYIEKSENDKDIAVDKDIKEDAGDQISGPTDDTKSASDNDTIVKTTSNNTINSEKDAEINDEPEEGGEIPNANLDSGTTDNETHIDTALSDNITVKSAGTENESKGLCILWFKTVWKMRGVYSGLAVHSFDVLTDILVIIQWIQLAQTPNDCHKNVDPQIMAWSGIAIMIASKAISAIAIFIKERNIRRAILQLFDLLIFEEIYETHNKITSQIKDKQSIEVKEGAVESTLSFKYIRSFEAIFESIPQSILQLVFIMRIESLDDEYSMGVIFFISIIQSIISMTNSILNNDNTQMQDNKWKKYKQRLPPTFEFFKHAICRLSEVLYRIGLLALFWTVCGGLPFGVMLAIDFVLTMGRVIVNMWMEETLRNADTILLGINSLIVIPAEEVYSISTPTGVSIDDEDDRCRLAFVNMCMCICCCYMLAAFITSSITCIKEKDICNKKREYYVIPTMRIGISMAELIFLIIYGIYGDNGENKKFLLSSDHGLYIFVTTCVAFLIYTQYRILFPDFSLPLKVNVRSIWGYAYSNELSELKKIKVRKGERVIKTIGAYATSVDRFNNAQQFWDQTWLYKDTVQKISAGVFAKAKGNLEIVSWLEEQGAIAHKQVTVAQARWLIGIDQNLDD